MIWDFFLFFLGAGLATVACWYFWKSTADERAHLQAKIDQLKAQITEKFE